MQDRFDIFLLDTDMSRTRFDPIIGVNCLCQDKVNILINFYVPLERFQN